MKRVMWMVLAASVAVPALAWPPWGAKERDPVYAAQGMEKSVYDADGDGVVDASEGAVTNVTAADVGAASPNLDDTDASVEWEDAADLDASGQVSVGFTAISMGATNASGLAAGDAFTWGPLSHRAVTITQMWFAAVGATATSVVVDVEERAWTNLNASGSIIASNLVIAADGLLVTTFADSNIAARASLYYSCDSATGVVEQIVGGIEYVLQ